MCLAIVFVGHDETDPFQNNKTQNMQQYSPVASGQAN